MCGDQPTVGSKPPESPQKVVTTKLFKKKEFFCSTCNQKFTQAKNLFRHEKQQHGIINDKAKKPTLICSKCDQKFFFHEQLIDHLNVKHFSGLVVKTEQPMSQTVFESWKDRLQRETNTSFTSTRNNTYKGVKTMYFLCNRSGSVRIKEDEDREKDYKGVISDKTNSLCASFLTVKVVDDQYIPSYCTTHTSHEIEVEHLRFNSSFKHEIASKLKMGVTINSLLKDIREQTDSAYAQLKNITRKTIENIIAKEGINLEYKLDADDAQSVDKFVQKDGGQSVFVYKPCGVSDPRFPDLKERDFAFGIMNDKQQQSLLDAMKSPTSILCSDATHGTSKYEIKLITLMTINSFGSGIPCAFLFSNREDETVLKYFFQGIKSRTGSLNPKVNLVL